MLSPRFASLATFLAAALTVAQAAPQQKPAAPAPKSDAPASLSELWVEPEPNRDLFYGVGGKQLAPDPNETYEVIEIKIRGFSEGYSVVDTTEREWSVKFPPEAMTEVALSRILWGIGYHQPPIYLMREWKARGATAPNPQLPARFREKHPDLHGLKAGESWDFKQNPFVGTRQLAGLVALQALVENPDVKASNNTVYSLTSPLEGAAKWYVIRDLGYSLGRAGFNSPRAEIEVYEKAPFIRGVKDGKVDFYFGGQNKSQMKNVTVADLHWICERLSRLTDKQWHDAFRAAAYEPTEADRFIAKIKSRIAEGLALKDDGSR